MKTFYLYVDENHGVSAFTEPNNDMQEFLEFGGGCRISVYVTNNEVTFEDENGPIAVDVVHVEEAEEED